jgi:undecaprenyl-diphosphatase
MNFNARIFQKINALQGKNPWLDAFGRAGAEWVVVGMLGWYVAASFIGYAPSRRAAAFAVIFLAAAWAMGWILDVCIGMIVREPRPHVTMPTSKLLFQPLMAWKSFPSDHAMSAWLIFFMALVCSLPLAWALLPLALWVSWGRVYAGVHYPFDILGGFGVATFVAVMAFVLLTSVT